MQGLVYNLIHDNKCFDGINLLEFLTCKCSNNNWKWEQWFIKGIVQNMTLHKKVSMTSFY